MKLRLESTQLVSFALQEQGATGQGCRLGGLLILNREQLSMQLHFVHVEQIASAWATLRLDVSVRGERCLTLRLSIPLTMFFNAGEM